MQRLYRLGTALLEVCTRDVADFNNQIAENNACPAVAAPINTTLSYRRNTSTEHWLVVSSLKYKQTNANKCGIICGLARSYKLLDQAAYKNFQVVCKIAPRVDSMKIK
jgi:hypothetical protein